MEQVEILRNNLKAFGLNPDNWKIFPKSEKNEFLIVNKKNEDFKMLGVSSLKKKNRSPQWKDILVVSI